jgi:hypothetical protein
MADLERPEINMAHIKVAGIGGLGMVAMVAVLAYNMPAVRTFVFLSAAGGVLIGLGVIAYRRWIHVEPPHGPTLMVDSPASTDAAARTAAPVDRSVKLAPVA